MGLPSVNGQVLWFVRKTLCGGLLNRGPSGCDPKRGQREEAGEFSVADSDGMVFEAACGCIENAEEVYVRLDKGKEESGGSLRGYPAGVRSWRMSSSSGRQHSRWTLRFRCYLPRLCARAAGLEQVAFVEFDTNCNEEMRGESAHIATPSQKSRQIRRHSPISVLQKGPDSKDPSSFTSRTSCRTSSTSLRAVASLCTPPKESMASIDETYSLTKYEPNAYDFKETYVESYTELLPSPPFSKQGFPEDAEYDDAALEDMLHEAHRVHVHHSQREDLSVGQSSSVSERTGRPVGERTGRPAESSSQDAQIRTLMDRQKERILAECQAEIYRHEFQADYDRRSLRKLGEIVES